MQIKTERQSYWMSVHEHLPPDENEVLVYGVTDDGYGKDVKQVCSGKFDAARGWTARVHKVAYWTEMPKLPVIHVIEKADE